MLRLLDKNRAVRPPVVNYQNLKIISTLENDDKELSFGIPITECDQELKEENFIQTENAEYVIKSKDNSGSFYNIIAKLNIDELEGTLFETFNSIEQTLKSAIDTALVGTGWTCVCELTKKRTLKLTNKSTWEIIKQAISTYRVEMIIDSLHKNITFVENRGEDKGVYFSDELNLKALHVNSNTNTFFTRILPIGKDGLTVESVNGGSKYVTDFTYSKKIKTTVWKDERYTVAQNLYDDAVAKLADIAKPYKSYSADVIDLANAYEDQENNPYDFLSYGLGDTATLLDTETGTREKQRIVKIVEYPDNPQNNTCEIANKSLTFEQYTQRYNNACDTVDNITTDNGTVDGNAINSLDANKLLNLDEVVAKTGNFQRIDTEILNVSGEITTVSEKVGTLEATTITATDADLKYTKTIDFEALTGRVGTLESNSLTVNSGLIHDLTSDVSKINALMFGSASGTSLTTEFSNSVIGLIGETQIKSAMIDSLSVDKVLAGDISTNKFKIKSDSGNMLIYDNTIQISDDTQVRVQIGKNTDNDYSISVFDANGKIMFDALGITEDAIKSAIIRNDMVSNTANIDASKLNIDSLFTQINGSSKTIKSNRIYIDADSQTLDIVFKSIKETINGMDSIVATYGTQITSIQGQISSKVWQQDIKTAVSSVEDDVTEINNQFSTLNQQMSSLSASVESNSTAITTKADSSTVTEVNSKVTNLTADLNGFKTSVANTYVTQETLDNYSTTTQVNSAIKQEADNIMATVSTTYATKGTLANYPTITQMDSAISTSTDTITAHVEQLIEANSNCQTYTVTEEPTLDNYPACDWFVPIYPKDSGWTESDYPGNWTWWYTANESYRSHNGDIAYLYNSEKSYRFCLLDTEVGTYGWKEQVNAEVSYMLTQISEVRTNVTSVTTEVSEVKTALYRDYSTTEDTKSLISSSATSVLANVSGTYVTQTDHNTDKRNLTASIELKLNKTDLVSEINASADVIRITADRFSLSSTYSKISQTGVVDFTSGKIAGWDINDQSIFHDAYVNGHAITGAGISLPMTGTAGSSLSSSVFLWCGKKYSDRNTAPYRVMSDGNVISDGDITSNGNMICDGNTYIHGGIWMDGRIEMNGTLHTVNLAVFDNGISLKYNQGLTAYYNDTQSVYFSGQTLLALHNDLENRGII